METAVPVSIGWIVRLEKKVIRKILQSWPDSIMLQLHYHFEYEVPKVRFHPTGLLLCLKIKESGLPKVCEINGKCDLSTKGEKNSACYNKSNNKSNKTES